MGSESQLNFKVFAFWLESSCVSQDASLKAMSMTYFVDYLYPSVGQCYEPLLCCINLSRFMVTSNVYNGVKELQIHLTTPFMFF